MRKNLTWRALPLAGLVVAIAAPGLASAAVKSPAMTIVGIVVLLGVVFA